MQPLGLRFYRALYPAEPAGASTDWPARPAGRLVWLHAPSALAARGFVPLIRGLRARGLADAVMLSCPEPLDCPGAPVVLPPADRPEAVVAFLAHWQPDLAIWADGALRPVLLQATAARAIPLMLVDGRGPELPGARWWRRLLLPRVLSPFAHLLVQDAEAARACQRAGARPERIRIAGLLEEPLRIQRVNEPERAALSRSFGTRPVWLAAGLPASEDELVTAAQLSALRVAHRLLLILVPDSPGRAAALAERLEGEYGLAVALRSRDDEPSEDVQVYIADTEGEMGLWYRLAPQTWCGGTLAGDGPLHHPFEPVAAGSALLHGPRTGEFATAFARLRTGGASRVVPLPEDLGEAVGDLLAADRSAQLAQRAWEVASSGVEATELALDLAAGLLAGTAA